jgi:ribosomal protein L4
VLSIVGLNVYDVLNYDELVMTKAAAKAIEARLTEKSKVRAEA